MSWYGSHVDSAKKLDQLVDQKPSLHQLLNYPDFIQQLKSYNPKLLQFLSNSNEIINQLLEYLSVPPKSEDSDQRKFKIPTISMQMVQTQAMSIVNSFFKINPKTKTKYIISLFQLVCRSQNKRQNNNSILPLLAGYFLRTNICLLNNKYKQTIDSIYEDDFCFNLLLENSQSLSMTNVLQVYLNLDMTKNIQTLAQRTNLKLKIVDKILQKIKDIIFIIQKQGANYQGQTFQKYQSFITVQNLSSVLIQILQKYYLISDGKAMIDRILQQKNIQSWFLVIAQDKEISMTCLTMISAVLKYYTFSSFNSQQLNNKQTNTKNEQRLQNQPFVLKLVQILPLLIKQLGTNEKVTIYHLKIIQTVNSAISLNSHKLFACITSHKYFQTIVDLLMKQQTKSILQMAIQRTFFILFKTEKLIFEDYRKHLFCTINIIDLTATRYLQLFKTEDQIIQSMTFSETGTKRKGYFGYLMKIMRNYSQIHTTDVQIVNSIKNKSQLWNKVNRLIIKPFFTLSLKQLGSYQNIPQKIPLAYSVKSTFGINNLQSKQEVDNNIKVIQQINRQQNIQNLKTLEQHQNKIQPQNHLPTPKIQLEKVDDQFFKTPQLQNISPQKKISAPQLTNQQNKKNQEQKQQSKDLQLKKSSFSQYMNTKKIEADRQIRTKRQNSGDGKLNKGKTRLASTSPKRNKWEKDSANKQQQKQRVSLTASNALKQQGQKKNHLPNIPHHKKGLSVSNQQNYEQQNKSMELQRKQQLQDSKQYSKSMVNLDFLKNVKFINRFEAPAKKVYVKMGEDDKAFLDMIGISYI